MASKRPVVAWGVVVVASIACLANGLSLLAALLSFGQRPVREVAVTAIVSILVAGTSAFIIRGTLRGSFRSRWPVSLYLWGLLIIYPVYNALRMLGWYLPGPQLSDEQLRGAAAAELLRYLVLLVLIVWVALSKRLKAYFSPAVPSVA